MHFRTNIPIRFFQIFCGEKIQLEADINRYLFEARKAFSVDANLC